MSREIRRAVPSYLLPLLILLVGACSRTEILFPDTASLGVSLADRGVTAQLEDGFNAVAWEVESLVVELDEPLTYVSNPCVHVQLGLVLPGLALPLRCDVPSFVAPAGRHPGVIVRLRLARLELRRAGRPDLPPEGDFDGDGVINADDVCPLLPDPDQQDTNADGVGDACSLPDSLGVPTLPDRDGDGVADGFDNCLWVPNPDQTDTPDLQGTAGTLLADRIGDACAPTIVGFGPQELTLGPFEPTFEAGQFQFVDLDFAGSVSCDPALAQCSFDPAAVILGVL